MKKCAIVVYCLALIFGLSGLAAAVPTTWTDTIDWNPDEKISMWSGLSYTHDITDDPGGFESYFMGGNDIIDSYSLTLSIYDDGGLCDWFEIARIDQPGVIGDGFYNFSQTSENFGWSIAGVLSLNFTGMIDVTVSSWFGDFYLDSSELVARGDNGTAPVPEPATLLLLGTGLLGLVGIGRKKFNKKA